MSLKGAVLEDFGYHSDGWQTDIGGTLICPHGNRCEDDLSSNGECGCTSPLVQEGLI